MEAKAAVRYKEDLLARLRDPEYATGYLNAVLEECDEAAFPLALRDVAEAKHLPLPATQLQWADVTGLLNALGIRLRFDLRQAV
jgi:DNA-binding phage protein